MGEHETSSGIAMRPGRAELDEVDDQREQCLQPSLVAGGEPKASFEARGPDGVAS